MMKTLVIPLLSLSLVACVQTGRYSQHQDSAPRYAPQRMTTQDAIPRYETYNPANSKPYVVFGKKYWPKQSAKGYTAEGGASWYGQKFHGHLTSNGERYNMYSMSAAHKTLPLPSFVKVTNLSNNKQVIVRVNDRGPFHGGRLIDLSYAAAAKLDMLKQGTARVKLQVIHVDQHGQQHIAGQPLGKPEVTVPATEPQKQLYIQVTALKDQQKIKELAKGLTLLYQIPTQTPVNNGISRLRLGPIQDKNRAQALLQQLKTNGYQHAFTLNAP